MQARAWTVIAVFGLLLAPFGCSKSSSPSGSIVGIRASRSSVVANGSNTVALTVTDTAGGPVAVTTTRGTFSGGGTAGTVPGASGTLTLVTCNAGVDANCAGTAVVRATSGYGSAASTSITFGTVASACRSDCTADPGCPTLACDLTGGGAGTCSSATPSVCVAAASYTISGTVSGAVVSGVSVTLTGTSTASATTDGSGNYSFIGLSNGSYTVTPSLSGYTFTPPGRSATVNGANVDNRNFTAAINAAPRFSITGTVSGAVSSPVSVLVSGQGTIGVSFTNGYGSYEFSGLADGNYSVTPSATGYTFSPATLSVTVSGAHQTGKNFTSAAAGGPLFDITGTVSGAVGSGVTVILTGPTTGTATTDGAGSYGFSGLANGTYSVTPFRCGCVFTPSNISVTVGGANQSGKDFTSVTATSGSISELPFTSFDPGPWDIAAGPDGNLWVTEYAAEKIARISLDGIVTEFPLPGGGMSGHLTGGPDGAVWFTAAGRIGRLAPDGTMTQLMLPNVNDWPRGITTGPDGALWFVQMSASVDRYTPAGVFAEFAVPGNSGLIDITVGPDGNLWFTEGGLSRVGRITTTGTVTEFVVAGTPEYIVAGPDGNLWFAEGDKIGRITPAGSVTEFPLPPNGAWPHQATGIAAGPDGNLWFTENMPNAVGRITLEGSITEFAIPTANSGAQAIALGPDGRLWFTEYYTNRIGCITP